jgi:hypothetical protein
LGSLTVNDQVASYTLVVGDVNKRVIMNSSSNTTITVNNSIFSAGNVVHIVNKGTASTVITAGAGVSITSSGSLTVPANGAGRLLALSASAFIYEAGGITASSGALTLIKADTFSGATTVSFPVNTFTSTYRNYKVLFVADCANTTIISLRLRAGGSDDTSSSYFGGGRFVTNTGGAFDITTNGADSLLLSFSVDTTSIQNVFDMTLFAPQLATRTEIVSGTTSANSAFGSVGGGLIGGTMNTATQYDAATFISSTAGGLSGYYRVYGYADS